jgi:hypothetical protein
LPVFLDRENGFGLLGMTDTKMGKAIYHYINTVVVGHFRVEIPSRKNYGVNFD